MIGDSKQKGFTAVELLITLFVAAGFLIASYQLFNLIIKDGGAARAESRAGNVAYDYTRRYASAATTPCTTQNPLTNSAITIDGLVQATVSVAIKCPVGYTVNSLSKIEVSVSYNVPAQTVTYATYAVGTGTAIADVTNGLVAWWKFNGNANSSVGTLSGTPTGTPTLTTGEDGAANAAYNFSGTSQYFNSGTAPSSFPLGSNPRTLCAWAKPSTVAAGVRTIAAYGSFNNNDGMFIGMSGTGLYGGPQSSGGTVASMWATGVWHNVCLVYNGAGSTFLMYRDGVLRYTSASGQNWSTRSTYTYIGRGLTNPGPETWAGDIDDVRVYNRAISGAEALTIFNSGAK